MFSPTPALAEHDARTIPWIGACFVVGPLLLLTSGVLAALHPSDTSWQGITGQFAGYCFIVTSLTIARLVARHRAGLGRVCTVVGLVGAAAMVQAFASYAAAGLLGRHLGFDSREALTTMSAAPSTAQLVGGLVGLTVPLSQVLLGASLLRTGAASTFSGVCITLGGVAFVAAQAILNRTGEWISPLLLLLGMVPIGARIWRSDAPTA